jgi:aminoglycoside phosphotransferase (APT) family kinase protein
VTDGATLLPEPSLEGAASAVEKLLGERPLAVLPIVRYAGRLVCTVVLPGRRLVFKAGLRDPLLMEAWVSRTLRPLGVRVAAVVAVDLERRQFPLDYLLMEELPGVPLAGWPTERELADLDFESPRLQTLLREVGRQLRLVHSLQMERFGSLDPGPLGRGEQPVGQAPTWAEHLAVDTQRNLRFLVHQEVLARAEADAITALLQTELRQLVLPKGRLLHGDFIPRHWFVEPTKMTLTGLLDFDVQSGDPAFDIAIADLDHEHLESDLGPVARLLLEGYGPEPRLLATLVVRQLLYKAVRALGEAAFMHANGEEISSQLRTLRWCLERVGARRP